MKAAEFRICCESEKEKKIQKFLDEMDVSGINVPELLGNGKKYSSNRVRELLRSRRSHVADEDLSSGFSDDFPNE